MKDLCYRRGAGRHRAPESKKKQNFGGAGAYRAPENEKE